MNRWICTIATALIALTAATCKKPPDGALSEAEDAVADAREKSECAEDKFEAAENLLEEAKSLSAQKKYDEAERKARAAKKLATKAEQIAEENWEDCQNRLADDETSESSESGEAADSRRGSTTEGESAELRTIYFDYDSADLSDQARQKLEQNVRWLKQNPDTLVVVEGHTDSRGSIEYNLALGERRANSVRDYLTQLGISGDRMNVLSYGEEKPAAYGDSKSAYSNNRRVEFTPKRE